MIQDRWAQRVRLALLAQLVVWELVVQGALLEHQETMERQV